MDSLETYIRNNRDQFDLDEPPQGHFRRFEEKLKQESRGTVVPMNRRTLWYRVAAAVLILVTAGLVTFDIASGRIFSSSRQDVASLNLPADVREAVDFYSDLSDRRMTELHKIASGCPNGALLLDKARREASLFDATNIELTKALTENPGNERAQAALIQNGKMKESSLNNLILQGNLDNCKTK
jgi:hypothetical protein